MPQRAPEELLDGRLVGHVYGHANGLTSGLLDRVGRLFACLGVAVRHHDGCPLAAETAGRSCVQCPRLHQ